VSEDTLLVWLVVGGALLYLVWKGSEEWRRDSRLKAEQDAYERSLEARKRRVEGQVESLIRPEHLPVLMRMTCPPKTEPV
jgi:hypothetical protein